MLSFSSISKLVERAFAILEVKMLSRDAVLDFKALTLSDGTRTSNFWDLEISTDLYTFNDQRGISQDGTYIKFSVTYSGRRKDGIGGRDAIRSFRHEGEDAIEIERGYHCLPPARKEL